MKTFDASYCTFRLVSNAIWIKSDSLGMTGPPNSSVENPRTAQNRLEIVMLPIKFTNMITGLKYVNYILTMLVLLQVTKRG